MSGIDLNRAGTPLLEIVTEPDMRSAAEAVAYAKALHSLVRWIGICDGNMQEGSFRCDANVSVRRPGEPLGTRCEIKNLNSFRFLEKAIEYEVRRQIELIEDGGKVVQETRLFDPDRGETRPMRSKEDAHDYRYFPDPDLLPLEITARWIERVKRLDAGAARRACARDFESKGISPYDAHLLTETREKAEFFMATARWRDRCAPAASVAQLGERRGLGACSTNATSISRHCASIGRAVVARLLMLIADGTISGKVAKEVLHRDGARRRRCGRDHREAAA